MAALAVTTSLSQEHLLAVYRVFVLLLLEYPTEILGATEPTLARRLDTAHRRRLALCAGRAGTLHQTSHSASCSGSSRRCRSGARGLAFAAPHYGTIPRNCAAPSLACSRKPARLATALSALRELEAHPLRTTAAGEPLLPGEISSSGARAMRTELAAPRSSPCPRKCCGCLRSQARRLRHGGDAGTSCARQPRALRARRRHDK